MWEFIEYISCGISRCFKKREKVPDIIPQDILDNLESGVYDSGPDIYNITTTFPDLFKDTEVKIHISS